MEYRTHGVPTSVEYFLKITKTRLKSVLHACGTPCVRYSMRVVLHAYSILIDFDLGYTPHTRTFTL